MFNDYIMFAFLEAVDQNLVLLSSSPKVLIIEAIFHNRSISCVISFKKMCNHDLVFSTFQDMNKNNMKVPRESRIEYYDSTELIKLIHHDYVQLFRDPLALGAL